MERLLPHRLSKKERKKEKIERRKEKIERREQKMGVSNMNPFFSS